MQREWFVFYQSFRNATKHLPKENQKNALVMIVEYGIDWIEPDPEIDWVAYAMFVMAKPQIDANNSRFIIWKDQWHHWVKWKDYGKLWWRPKKPKPPDGGINGNPPKTPQDIKKNPPKDKVKDNVKVKDNEEILLNNTNKSLSIDKEQQSWWLPEINFLIEQLKQTADLLWIAYVKKDERNFAKHILSSKEYWSFCEKIWQDRLEFAKNIMIASSKIGYWKWPRAGPREIYQDYADVYNSCKKIQEDQEKNKIAEF